MDKKKHGLVAWSIIVVITLLLAAGGFVFGFFKEGLALWTTSVSSEIYLVTGTNFLLPVVYSFTNVIMDFTSPIFIVLVSYLGVIALLLIAFIITAAARKNAKYLWHVIPYLIFATLGLYFICAFTVTSHEPFDAAASPILLAIQAKSGPLYDAIKGTSNSIQSYIAWGTVVAIGLYLISFFAYTIMLLVRAGAKHEQAVVEEERPAETMIRPAEEKTKTIAIPTVPMITPAVVEETEPVVEEPVEEKPKRKVFLVVKKYNASADSVEAVVEDKKPENLTAEDIREIIRSEHEAYENRRIAEEASRNFDKANQAASTCAPAETHETRTVAPSPVKDEVKAPVTPIIIAIPDPVVDDDEEVPSQTQENTKSSPVSRDQIRDIVRDELKRAIEKIVSIPQETVVTETVEEVEETPVASTNETIAVLDEKNVPVDVKEEPAATKEDDADDKNAEPIERISFADRIRKADDEMKDNYNKIKSLLMSYGLKNRVSNGGDAFRLHKVTYAKIAVAGKSLKIYLALDPADYKNTTLPIKDASSKAIYKEIPLVFKVKSGLSMRRCEQLIGEMMDKHHIDQVDRVIERDYVALLDVNTDDDDE